MIILIHPQCLIEQKFAQVSLSIYLFFIFFLEGNHLSEVEDSSEVLTLDCYVVLIETGLCVGYMDYVWDIFPLNTTDCVLL